MDSEPISGSEVNEVSSLKNRSGFIKDKRSISESISPAESPGTKPDLPERRKKSSFSGKLQQSFSLRI